jgi:molybdenum cofactor biosynthesis protein B
METLMATRRDIMCLPEYRPLCAHNLPVSVREHKAQAPSAVGCYVLTISDTRRLDTDTSGQAIRSLLQEAGHVVSGYDIEPDDPDRITMRVVERLADPATQAIISTGGTGTFEAVTRLFDKRLDGFGELFRMISFEEIGAAAMLSRATAGTVGRKVIFALPGSEKAVRLAMTRLVIPELGHVIQQLSK